MYMYVHIMAVLALYIPFLFLRSEHCKPPAGLPLQGKEPVRGGRSVHFLTVKWADARSSIQTGGSLQLSV